MEGIAGLIVRALSQAALCAVQQPAQRAARSSARLLAVGLAAVAGISCLAFAAGLALADRFGPIVALAILGAAFAATAAILFLIERRKAQASAAVLAPGVNAAEIERLALTLMQQYKGPLLVAAALAGLALLRRRS